MDRYLPFLKDIGLLDELPTETPPQGTVLARSACFLHGGDNPNAFLLFADGFVCTTHDCHKDRSLGRNIPGLIRHIVQRLTGEAMEWRAAWRWAKDNRVAIRKLVGDHVRAGKAKGSSEEEYVTWTDEELAACLQVPDPYYLSRGYRPETLRHFGVGRCVLPLPDGRDTLKGWSVFPVRSEEWWRHMLWGNGTPLLHGYTARNPRHTKRGESIKWLHAVKRDECVYNFGCHRPGKVEQFFICEGPGCVMRLWEAGYPYAVALLGASLSPSQHGLLHLLSLYLTDTATIYIAGDNDEKGRAFAEEVRQKIRGGLTNDFPVPLFPPDQYKDVGDMPADELRAWLSPKLAA